MAEAQSHEYHHGEMDASTQTHDFHVFIGFTKWACLYLGALLLMLTMWFCTSAGFGPAFISAVIVIAVGVLVLRDKPGAAH